MINIIERQFDPLGSEAGRLAKKIKERAGSLFKRFGAYLKRLLFPLYLFPIKLITYTAYYFVKFLIKFIFAFIGLIFETIIFPFKSLKNWVDGEAEMHFYEGTWATVKEDRVYPPMQKTTGFTRG